MMNKEEVVLQKATFGAGCFWGVEAAFREVKGVISTVVGYMGGDLDNPSYQDVCTGTTGHSEVVEVIFNSHEVSYRDLLRLFWSIHDPTTVNRQGPDVGVQYRSVIFYHDLDQKKLAEKMRDELQKSNIYPRDIVTAIEPAQTFWKAEDYHQQYFEKTKRRSCF
ncbi:MAG: peptide-methionine (S)-S-oxide reductase MsrA [Euryarchaeota archaeon]|nr:peptide-methionine (S)-S-oxide reductase MsrA [Euryarchaeota archaeon]